VIGLIGLFTLLGLSTGNVPTATAVTYKPATFVRTLGGPGHAGIYPWGATTALDGSIIITDYWNYTVRRFSPEGVLQQTFGGPKGGTEGPQNQAPHGAAVDPTDGSIWISDINNEQMDVFDSAGNYEFSHSVAFSRNYTPRIAINSVGALYIPASHTSEDYPHRVVVYDENHDLDFVLGSAGSADGEFGIIRGIDTGPDDEVYVLDSGNHRIQVFDAEGNFLRKWGSAGTDPGQFGWDMRGLIVDDANEWVYVVDAQQSQIEKFDLNGTPLATWGSEGTGPGQFRDGGREITLSLDGSRVYAPDFGNNRINVYDSDGNFEFDFPNPPPAPPNGGFNLPQGVAVNAAGTNIFTADTYNHRIQRFSPTAFTGSWGFRGTTDDFAFNYPRGVAIDPSTGDVWINNTREGNIKVYKPDMSQLIRTFNLGGLSNSRGIWVGKDNRVYITDGRSEKLYVTDKLGNLIYSRPCTGNGSSLDGCTGVSLDSNNYIYAASPVENKIYRWNPTGAPLAKWGAFGTGPGKISKPFDVDVYQNRVYVVEAGNHRISVFTKAGGYLGKFGSKGGGPGQLRDPRSISIDQNGMIYVMDQGNERIVVFKQS
jgi:DNA-binding beta-propeller fold protein YncE